MNSGGCVPHARRGRCAHPDAHHCVCVCSVYCVLYTRKNITRRLRLTNTVHPSHRCLRIRVYVAGVALQVGTGRRRQRGLRRRGGLLLRLPAICAKGNQAYDFAHKQWGRMKLFLHSGI